MSHLKFKFFKQHLIERLTETVKSPHKDTIVESFISITDSWFFFQLCNINEIFRSYKNPRIEIYEFITKEEIISILSIKQNEDEVSLNNLIIRLKNLIQEQAILFVGKDNLVANYNELNGTIIITYAQ